MITLPHRVPTLTLVVWNKLYWVDIAYARDGPYLKPQEDDQQKLLNPPPRSSSRNPPTSGLWTAPISKKEGRAWLRIVPCPHGHRKGCYRTLGHYPGPRSVSTFWLVPSGIGCSRNLTVSPKASCYAAYILDGNAHWLDGYMHGCDTYSPKANTTMVRVYMLYPS